MYAFPDALGEAEPLRPASVLDGTTDWSGNEDRQRKTTCHRHLVLSIIISHIWEALTAFISMAPFDLH